MDLIIAWLSLQIMEELCVSRDTNGGGARTPSVNVSESSVVHSVKRSDLKLGTFSLCYFYWFGTVLAVKCIDCFPIFQRFYMLMTETNSRKLKHKGRLFDA